MAGFQRQLTILFLDYVGNFGFRDSLRLYTKKNTKKFTTKHVDFYYHRQISSGIFTS